MDLDLEALVRLDPTGGWKKIGETMLTSAYYEDRAQICEMLAAESPDHELAGEWRLMAQDWRSAASLQDAHRQSLRLAVCTPPAASASSPSAPSPPMRAARVGFALAAMIPAVVAVLLSPLRL